MQPSIPDVKTYHPAKQLPYEIREHCIIYLEEQMYTQALTFLNNLLASGITPSTPPSATFIPPPNLLALVATLTVHPSLTTRANSNDKLVASNTSLHFLYSVLKLVGPVNSGFATAFAFREQSGGSHRKLNRAQQIKLEQEEGYSPIGVVQEEVENIDSEIANEGGLWARGEDFWHVLGWAFNCSVRWPGRWQRWKMWLGFMVELLEDDWEERLGLVVEPGKENVLRESLIMQYLDVAGTAGRTGRRGIMRAIFADGSPKAMGEFKEVFRNETKERKKPDVVNATRKKVNIDEGNFGDYFEDENGDEVEVKVEIKEEDGGRRSSKKFSRGPTTPKRGSAMAVGDTARLPEVSSTEAFENVDALLLRRRILVLFTQVATNLPRDFTSLEELLDIFTEFIRPLPLPIFSFFVCPAPYAGSQHFPNAIQSTLNQMLLRPLLASTAPRYDERIITQEKLTTYYLPHAANTTSIADSAKVSLVVEALMRLLRQQNELRSGNGLEEAAAKGIDARTKKGFVNAKPKTETKRVDDEEAVKWLELSARRLEFMVEAV